MKDQRKVIKIGNSSGITLSTDMLEAIGVSSGDWVEVQIQERRGRLVLSRSALNEAAQEIDDAMAAASENIEIARTRRAQRSNKKRPRSPRASRGMKK